MDTLVELHKVVSDCASGQEFEKEACYLTEIITLLSLCRVLGQPFFLRVLVVQATKLRPLCFR